MEIGIFHYSMPPVIGGVERVIAAHARLFLAEGHGVTLFQASDLPPGPAIAVPGCHLGDDSGESRSLITSFLRKQKIDLWIVHNIFTMPFCLAATAALWDLAESRVPMISWIHDLAADNPHYQIPAEGLPGILRRHPPGVLAIAVSEERRAAYQKLTGHMDAITIPNGVEYYSSLGVSPGLEARLTTANIADAAPVLLHPTRILRRKNILLGLKVTAELKKAGKTPLYIITGAPDSFSGQQKVYRAELDDFIAAWGISENVLFLGDDEPLDDAAICALYRLCDAVFFPSEQEGFGLPVIEAGLQRVPVFCQETLPLSALARKHGLTFPLEIPPARLAGQIENFLADDPATCLRRTIQREYSWDTIFHRHISPALRNFTSPLHTSV